MAWDDREYRWSLYSPTSLTPAVKMLLIITGAVFVAEMLLGGEMLQVFGLVPAFALGRLCLWQFVTYLFLHDPDRWVHIVFNMLLLYWLGPGVERLIGTKRFVWFYLAAGAVAGVVHCAGGWFVAPQRPVIGASGAIMALMVCYAMHYPDQMILVFLLIPMKIKHCVMLLIGIDLFLTLQAGAGGHVASLAHLGGAGFGYLYYRFAMRAGGASGGSFGGAVGGWLDGLKERAERRRRLRRLEEDERVEDLLAKISREGMNSLTETEKQFLVDAARRRREGR